MRKDNSPGELVPSGPSNEGAAAVLAGCVAQLNEVLELLDRHRAPAEIVARIDEAIGLLQTLLVP
jgi:hypothetical protein